MIDIKVQVPRLNRIFPPKAVLFAESQALNRTAANVQKVGLQAVADEMGIDVSDLRKRAARGSTGRGSKKFGAVAKGRRATLRRLFTSVTGFGRPLNAGRWDGQQVRINRRVRGTTHSAYGRGQVAKNTWMLRTGAIVVRDGASFRGVYGPGVGQMMQRPGVVRKLDAEVFKRFPKHFSSALDFALSDRGTRFGR